ncbi:tyrosine-type recombinase/integrase [Photobacterium sp. WH24]|uniref:tyrosine-type recombinase/integrase n=1 Tax=Photobacterium sp. WH24 TaxID=2827237 RepID=UPI001C458388|nr:tyrosine-type recombinase/integrase [Photobacterium sp. WH24]MBV7264341.1 tyrosine-type recombinase/integrase [Photobacterium sp. WH24]
MPQKRIIESKFNDEAIKRAQKDESIYELNITNQPLRLRFTQARDKAAWFYVFRKDGKACWRKLGTWPLLDAKRLRDQLSDITANVAAGQNIKSVSADHFDTVGELLAWFQERNEADKTISNERRIQLRSAINKHLFPLLKDLPINAVSKSNVEEKLFRPLFANDLALSTVRSYFNMLSAIFERALELGKISYNPMLEIRFKKLIKKDIPTKDGKLKPGHIPDVMAITCGKSSLAKTLVFMMLSHGTRQGETRMARWSHIDLSNMTWYLPTENIKTKRHEHTLPITPEVFDYLKLHRNFLKESGYTGDYIFPSNLRKNDCPPISRSKACRMVKELSAGNWRSHDLRKLAATSWKERKEDWLVIKFLLNHHIPNLDRTYIQAEIEPLKRDVLERWQAFLSQEKSKIIARWEV